MHAARFARHAAQLDITLPWNKLSVGERALSPHPSLPFTHCYWKTSKFKAMRGMRMIWVTSKTGGIRGTRMIQIRN